MQRAVLSLVACLLCAALASGCSLFSSPDAKPEPGTTPPAAAQAPASDEPSAAEEAETLFAKAHVLWKGGGDVCSDPAMAVHLLDQAIALKPDYADAFMRRGLAYSELRNDEEAFSDLTHAIRLDPKPVRYAYRGLGLIRQENLAGARRDLDQSIELDSDQFRAWNLRAVVNVMEHKDDQACSDFNTGCKNGDCSGLNAAKKQGICR